MATPFVENGMNLDMFSDLTSQDPVQTTSKALPPSLSFIDKVLHPPSAVPGFVGLPTNDARSQVIAEWRNLNIMTTPVVCLESGAKTTALTNADMNNFNVGYLVLNGARVLSVGFIYNATTGLWYQDLANTDLQDVYDFNHWHQDANLYRPAYKSLTTYLNATAFNDTGSVTVSSFNPSVMFSGTLGAMSIKEPQLFHALCEENYHHSSAGSGLFYHQKHPEYLNGVEHFKSYPPFTREHISKIWSEHVNTRLNGKNPGHEISVTLDPAFVYQLLNLNGLSINTLGGTSVSTPTTSQILNQSIRSYAGKAKEGTFSVAKFNTTAPAWKSASNANVGSSEQYLYNCALVSFAADGTIFTNTLHEGAKIGVPFDELQVLKDTLWTSDMTCTWIRYEGLSFNPTQTQNQLLIRKYYSGFEIQPALNSAWAGMQKAGPPPDLAAMQALMDGFYTMKDGMPAKYNFLGTLGPLIMQGITTLGSSLLGKLFSTKKEAEKERVPKSIKRLPKNREYASRPSTTHLALPATSLFKKQNERINELQMQLKQMKVSGSNRSRNLPANNGNKQPNNKPNGNRRRNNRHRNRPVKHGGNQDKF